MKKNNQIGLSPGLNPALRKNKIRAFEKMKYTNMYTNFIEKILPYLFLTLVILFSVGLSMKAAVQKRSYFVDEMHSYASANSVDFLFLNTNCSLLNKWVPGEHFYNHYVVQKGHEFDYAQVVKNNKDDDHPLLYFSLLFTVSSFFPGQFSKWLALSINIVGSIFLEIFLFLIMMKLLKKNLVLSLSAVALWGCTFIGISNIIFIRMYLLVTLFTTMMYYFHVCLLDTEKKETKYLIGIFISVYLGAMTQYFFLIAAFFLAISTGIVYLYRKNRKKLFLYAGTMAGAVALFFVSNPWTFVHVFGSSHKGKEVFANGTTFEGVASKISFYSRCYFRELTSNDKIVSFIIAVMLTMIIVLVFELSVRKLIEKSIDAYKAPLKWLFYMLGSLVPTFCIIAIVTPFWSPRYLYFIYPVMTVCLFLLIFMLENLCCDWKIINFCIFFFVLSLSIQQALSCVNPNCECARWHNEESVINSYRNKIGIVFSVLPSSHTCITQESLVLQNLKAVYFTLVRNAGNISEFLGKKYEDESEILLFADINTFSDCTLMSLKKEIEATSDYMFEKNLYSNGVSSVYLLKKKQKE